MTSLLRLLFFMKSKYIKFAVAALLVTGCCAVKADGLLDSKRAEIKTALAGATLKETIKTSISLIAGASEKDQVAVTLAVVQDVAQLHSSFVPSLIAAIGHKVPAMVAVAAREAVRMNPEQASAITKLAIEAASGQAVTIVKSVLSIVPARYQSVGYAAIEAAPSQSRDILNVIAQNVSGLKAYIDTALAGNASVSASIAENILRHAAAVAVSSPSQTLAGAQASQDGSASASGSQFFGRPTSTRTPPVLPPPAGAVNLNPGNTAQAPVGPQQYSPP